jgi:hypothetical protein
MVSRRASVGDDAAVITRERERCHFTVEQQIH